MMLFFFQFQMTLTKFKIPNEACIEELLINDTTGEY